MLCFFVVAQLKSQSELSTLQISSDLNPGYLLYGGNHATQSYKDCNE